MRPKLGTLLPAIVGALAPLSACSSTNEPTAMPETAPCMRPLDENAYAGVTLAPGIDGIIFFDTRSGKRVGLAGEPCARATDHDACIAQLDKTNSRAGWTVGPAVTSIGESPYKQYGVVTVGDDVRLVTSFGDLLPLIVPIDSLAEAAVVAALSGRSLSCEGTNAQTAADGFLLQQIEGGCSAPEVEVLFKVHRDGTITEVERNRLSDKIPGCIEGRRPDGYVVASRPWLESLPAHIAEIAHMEAAAVLAFDDLTKELALHGAPESLLRRALRAGQDEIAHAAIMLEHATGFGVTPPQVERRSFACRSLFALAVDNAVEGCVRETYGALVATYQSVHAADPALRAAFTRIARDEADHAQLSLDLADWLGTRLSRRERRLVARAEARAFEQLFQECRTEPSTEVVAQAGMPTAPVALALLERLGSALGRIPNHAPLVGESRRVSRRTRGGSANLRLVR
jgi:hypothetical protein